MSVQSCLNSSRPFFCVKRLKIFDFGIFQLNLPNFPLMSMSIMATIDRQMSFEKPTGSEAARQSVSLKINLEKFQ